MERMSKEKESGTLLGVGTAYLPVKEIKGEFYVKVSDFTRCMDGIRIEQEADRKHIEELEEENKNLNIKVASLEGEIKGLNSVIDKLKEENQTLELWLDNKEKVNKKLREELSIYDREYFDEDKKAEHIFMEEDTLQELRDIGELNDGEGLYE